MRKYIIIVLILCSLQSKAVRNWYIAANGSDANTGTISAPFKTINKMNSVFSSVVPGDSILFKKGDSFIGTLTVTKSGTSLASITIAYYGSGSKPIITSLIPIIGFAAAGNGIYTSSANSSLLSTCNIVLMNGVMQQLGRFPNANAANSGYLLYQSSTSTSITSTSLSSTTNWTGASAFVRTQKFLVNTLPISSQSGSKINFPTTTPLLGTPVNGAGFFICKDIRTLDQNGEWFYKVSTKQVSIFNNTVPTNVTATSLNSLILSSGFSFITIDGLDLRGSNFNGIDFTNGSGWQIKNTDINWCGNRAILDESSNNLTVSNCTINNSLTDGIYLHNVSNSAVSNTTIHNSGEMTGAQGTNGQNGSGINHRGFNTSFTNVTVINSGYDGISSVPSTSTGGGITYQNCYVDTFCNVTNDGGGLYTVNSSKLVNSNIIFLNNIVMNGIGAVNGSGSTNSNTNAEGIYLDNDTRGATVIGNTIYRTQRAIYLHFATFCNVRGNTGFDNLYGVYAQSRSGDRLRNCTQNANKFIARTATQYSGYFITDSASVTGDIKQFFTSCDSNYYCRPINQIATPTHMRNSSTNVALPTWQTAYNSTVRTPPYDNHSLIAPQAITSDGQFYFNWNATTSPVLVTLPSGVFKDMTGLGYSGTTTLQPFTSVVLISTGSQTTPTIIWANPSPITYNTDLTGKLNANTSVAGTFAYNENGVTITNATILSAGVHTLTTVFTPNDPVSYTTATKSVSITVNKATATLSYTVLSRPYTGLPQGVGIVTSPSGLTGVNTLYDGVGQTPTNAGSYAVTSGLTNANYTAAPISSAYTITQIPATLTVSNLAQTYDGTQKSVTVVTNPLGLSGVGITYNGSGTTPSNAGTYTIVATLTNQNYTASPITTLLVIAKAVPTVTWATPSPITYGTALSGTQLNASASVAGTFTYTPASGSFLNVGTQTLSVDFTSTDAANYTSVINTTVNLVVNKATATISLGNLNQTYDGTGKSVTYTTSPANLQTVSVTYNGSATLPINPGTYAVVASLTNANYNATPATGNLVISTTPANIYITNLAQTYTGSPLPVTVTTNPAGLSHTTTYNASATVPTNAGSYTVIATINDGIHTGADTQTLVISKAIPVLTWGNPSDITFGTALSSTQLNASSSVAGSFVYSPPTGTVLNVGNAQVLSTTFTPTDASNYVSISKTVLINVTSNTATLNLSGLNQVYNGNPKPVIVITSPVGLSGVVILYNGSATVPTNAGSYTVNVSLSNPNYVATPVSGTLVISKINPVVTWPATVPIPLGTPLSSLQLNASANVSGVFVYSPAAGTVLPSGSQILSTTFTPADTTNYNTVVKTNTISVYGNSNPSQSFYIINGQTIYINLP